MPHHVGFHVGVRAHLPRPRTTPFTVTITFPHDDFLDFNPITPSMKMCLDLIAILRVINLSKGLSDADREDQPRKWLRGKKR